MKVRGNLNPLHRPREVSRIAALINIPRRRSICITKQEGVKFSRRAGPTWFLPQNPLTAQRRRDPILGGLALGGLVHESINFICKQTRTLPSDLQTTLGRNPSCSHNSRVYIRYRISTILCFASLSPYLRTTGIGEEG